MTLSIDSIVPEGRIYVFAVEGLKCQNCSQKVMTALEDCQGILSKECDSLSKLLRVTVKSDANPASIEKIIIQKVQAAGFGCTPYVNEQPNKNSSLFRWFLGLAGTASGAVLMAMMLIGVTFSMPVMAAIAAISTTATLALGAEFYWNALQVFIRSRELNMNTLFSISTLTVLVVSISAFFVPGLPMIFDAGLMIFGFRHLGIAIEESLKHSVITDTRFVHYLPHKVRVIKEDAIDEKLLVDARVDDVIEIRAGEVIPVDGVCLSSECSIYDTIRTGSRLPRAAQAGSELIAGMFLAEHSKPLHLKVGKRPQDSYLARFDQQIQSAKQKQPLQTIAQKILTYFIPAVLLLSFSSFVIVSYFFASAIAIQCAIAVLVSACPCTLGMILPLSLKIGMDKSANHGVQFKSSKALEEIGELAPQIDVVAFDLHGTLTQGKPEFIKFERLEMETAEEDILRVAAKLEQQSPHPFGKVICEYIREKNITVSDDMILSDVNQKNSSGISARIDGCLYAIGSRRMMSQIGIDASQYNNEQTGDSFVYLARASESEKTIIARFKIVDPLRLEAPLVIENLKRLGVKRIVLITGADEKTVCNYKLEGIDSIYTAPEKVSGIDHKMGVIKSYQQQNLRVAFVGDGPNDAPALAAADVGIAMKTGDDIGHKISQEQAGAVITNQSLNSVLSVFEISKQTVSNIKQNLLLSFGYNLATIAMAGGGVVSGRCNVKPGCWRRLNDFTKQFDFIECVSVYA